MRFYFSSESFNQHFYSQTQSLFGTHSWRMLRFTGSLVYLSPQTYFQGPAFFKNTSQELCSSLLEILSSQYILGPLTLDLQDTRLHSSLRVSYAPQSTIFTGLIGYLQDRGLQTSSLIYSQREGNHTGFPHSNVIDLSTSHASFSVQDTSRRARVRSFPSRSRQTLALHACLLERSSSDSPRTFRASRRKDPQTSGQAFHQWVYVTKWQQWLLWSESRDFQSHHPFLPDFSSFLLDLFQQSRAVRTLVGYRAILASTLNYHSDWGITHSPELYFLLESFNRRDLQWPAGFPNGTWRLGQGLSCPFLFLAWKTAFLLILASGLRRGFLHAFPLKGVSSSRDHSHIPLVLILVSPQGLGLGQVTPFSQWLSKYLKPLVGRDKDRTLCPTSTLLTQRKSTEPIRGDRKLL